MCLDASVRSCMEVVDLSREHQGGSAGCAAGRPSRGVVPHVHNYDAIRARDAG